MLDLIKQEILNSINSKIEKFPVFENIRRHIDARFTAVHEAYGALNARIATIDPIIEAIRVSYNPVVLFKGSIYLYSRDEQNRAVFTDYAFAHKANSNLLIDFQPNATIRLSSVEVLNGPYDIVRLMIANVDVIATNQGILPRNVPIPLDFEIQPANRVVIQLAVRKLD